jgi:hypothetical protein
MSAQQEFHFLLRDLLCVEEQPDLRGFSEMIPDLTSPIIEGISGYAAGSRTDRHHWKPRDRCSR